MVNKIAYMALEAIIGMFFFGWLAVVVSALCYCYYRIGMKILDLLWRR
jgi:hypothetical protein